VDLRLFTAIAAAKLLKITINIFGGGGTAAPGLLAEYIDPAALRKLTKYYQGTILVTGTNGKTTTSRLLGNILSAAKIPFIHNRSGSNLLRGLVGTFVDNVGFGKMNKNLALLEVDEATLPAATGATNPKVIIFNNLFRDQLDRYGEVDKIRKIWQKALLHLDSSTVLVLNSDDHSVAHLASNTRAKAVYFGIEDAHLSLGKLPHASDFTSCIACEGELRFDEVYLSHLGKYKCASCGLERPKTDVAAEKIFLNEEKGFIAQISTPRGSFELKVALPGLYNVYNVLAAVSAALALGIGLPVIKKGLESSLAAFGRTERIHLDDGKVVFLALVKNPAGFNEILRTLFSKKERKYAFIAINDLIADGRDVSWLWDVDFEVLTARVKKLWISGIRAADMALRIKYSGAALETEVNNNLEEAINGAIEEMPAGETLYVLPTYTAMLALKKFFVERGASSHFWED
jgi:UDP-N-acetylmuramyl tripeptide synthase